LGTSLVYPCPSTSHSTLAFPLDLDTSLACNLLLQEWGTNTWCFFRKGPLEPTTAGMGYQHLELFKEESIMQKLHTGTIALLQDFGYEDLYVFNERNYLATFRISLYSNALFDFLFIVVGGRNVHK